MPVYVLISARTGSAAEAFAYTLQAAGREVVMTEREGGHGDPFWRDELPLMAAWAFTGPRSGR